MHELACCDVSHRGDVGLVQIAVGAVEAVEAAELGRNLDLPESALSVERRAEATLLANVLGVARDVADRNLADVAVVVCGTREMT